MHKTTEEGLRIYKDRVKGYIKYEKPERAFGDVNAIRNFLRAITFKMCDRGPWWNGMNVAYKPKELEAIEEVLGFSDEEICNIWNEILIKTGSAQSSQ